MEGLSEPDWIARIQAAPDDHQLKLVWADVLMQRGDPRGELIAASIRLLNMPASAPAEERQRLRDRCRELMRLHESRWLAPLRPHVVSWSFEHGVLHHLRLYPSTFATRADELFRHAPFVRSVTLVGDQGVYEFLASPRLSRLNEVTFPPLDEPLATALANTEAAKNLTRLRSSDGRLGDAGVRVLCDSPHLSGLTSLELPRHHIGPQGAHAIATAFKLQRLELDENPLGDSGIEALSTMETLRELRLHRVGMGKTGLTALATSPALRNLQTLLMPANQPGLEGFAALGASQTLKALSELNVAATGMGESELTALLSGGGLPCLMRVLAHMNLLSDAEIVRRVQAAVPRRLATS